MLGVTLAPEKLDGPVAGVLGEIAAPLTADDLSPAFWLILAGMAAGLLGILIAVTRKRR